VQVKMGKSRHDNVFMNPKRNTHVAGRSVSVFRLSRARREWSQGGGGGDTEERHAQGEANEEDGYRGVSSRRGDLSMVRDKRSNKGTGGICVPVSV